MYRGNLVYCNKTHVPLFYLYFYRMMKPYKHDDQLLAELVNAGRTATENFNATVPSDKKVEWANSRDKIVKQISDRTLQLNLTNEEVWNIKNEVYNVF